MRLRLGFATTITPDTLGEAILGIGELASTRPRCVWWAAVASGWRAISARRRSAPLPGILDLARGELDRSLSLALGPDKHNHPNGLDA